MFSLFRIGILILFLTSCKTTDPIEQAKNAQAQYLREQCMNSVTGVERPNPIMRTEMLQNCNAWARKRAGL